MTPFVLALGLLTQSVAVPPARASSTQSPQTDPAPAQPAPSASEINVNWLYGAYVPKDMPLVPLTNRQRAKLWVQQTFLTPGIYGKTGFFATGDQITDDPSEWDQDVAGFGQRFVSRYGQFAIQNTLASAGNALLGYEPRYERCRCDTTWPRVRHALARNFITYNRTERERRPQLAMYTGALVAGTIASTWKPAADDAWTDAWQSAVTQAAFGSIANVVAEFAPEILKLLGRKSP